MKITGRLFGLMWLVLLAGLSVSFWSCEQPLLNPVGGQVSVNSQERVMLAEGQAAIVTPVITILPTATPIPPITKLTGTVEKVVVYPGTKSEYSYFCLNVGDDLTERPAYSVILFNARGRSEGFDIYVKVKVTVTGTMGTGTIGWMYTPAKGLFVKEISPVQPYIIDEGVVTYINLEGGFYGIKSTRGNYDPINLPKEFMQNGLKVKFSARILYDMASIHMWGTLIEIIQIEKQVAVPIITPTPVRTTL